MRRLLVTGGAGFIGSHFVEMSLGGALAEARDVERLVVLDALTYAGKREHLAAVEQDARFAFVHGDVADRPLIEGLFAEHRFDTVVHFAAESHVDRSIEDGAPFVHTNVVGTFTLLDVARAAWTRGGTCRFVQVSTDEVYGPLGAAGRASEDSPYAPSSPYAASKAAGDHFARAYFVTHRLPVIVTHCCNNLGPRQADEKLVPRFVRNAIAGIPMPLYGDGRQVRDWLAVEDHARGLWRAIVAGTPGRTYLFGGVREAENREMATRIADAVDTALGRPAGTSRALITPVEDRAGHDFRYALDSRRTKGELDWEPTWTLEEALAAVVREHVDRRPR
ncbi:MAG: dTDP-glucose 4,6-dehydratase [Polyangiaceae bacterium]|jgi:dTDP-glucose 4,6-dehydratase